MESANQPGATLDEARRLHQAGRLADAERLYRQLLDADPDNASVLSKLAAALAGQRRLDDAVATLKHALVLEPRLVEAHNNIGIVFFMQGRAAEAADAFEAALNLDPDHAAAHVNLGNLHRSVGRTDAAAESYRRALATEPAHADALNGLGAVLLGDGLTDEARDAFLRAVAANPNHAEALNNLGSIQRNEGAVEDAVETLRRAIRIRPDLSAAYVNLGNALRTLGRLDEAAEALSVALEREPENAEAHWNLAHVRLAQGRLPEGWAEFEWRAKCAEFRPHLPHFGTPPWDGDALDGGTLLIYAEQGYGDTIQFYRFAPVAAAFGGRVVLQCQDGLVRLLTGGPGIERTVARIEDAGRFDAHVSLLSLPHVFGTELESIPDAVPYVHPPADAAPPPFADSGLKVGIVWAGNPRKKVSKDYSMTLENFLPLLDIAGCAFYSLQVGPGADDIRRLGVGGRVQDLGRDFADFADTAAVIAELDLVISIDTAVAHLAGALARPTWTLLSHAPDWRWHLDRADTPWYPTMRLFRQPAPRDWDSVFADVRRALEARVAGAE